MFSELGNSVADVSSTFEVISASRVGVDGKRKFDPM